MRPSSRLAACLVSLWGLWGLTGTALADPALGYRISGPAVHGNLAVYFVHGSGAAAGAAAPLTLDQAVGGGQAKLRWTGTDPVTVENVSDRSIFIPFATLLTGGMQDQVTSTSLLLPPHSGPVPLATFCVDPFRSSARDGEDPATLAAANRQFPGRMAKLVMLADAPRSKAVERLRQSGVWWSIDTTRTELSRRLGGPIEPPRQAHWNTEHLREQVSSVMLAARQSSWLTSLPLALENLRLESAQQAYVNAIEATADMEGDVIGAVFALNGSLDSAEIYQSHALFDAMWPRLLQARAVEALAVANAAGEAGTAPPVPVFVVEQFLATAQAGAARPQAKGQHAVLRDSDAAIYAETGASDGTWVNRSFVARSAHAADTPEAAILRMLEAGQVNDRPLASLGDRSFLIMRRDAAGTWKGALYAAVPPLDLAGPWRALYGDPGAAGADRSMVMPGLMALAFFAFLFWIGAPPRRTRRHDFVQCRLGPGDVAALIVAREDDGRGLGAMVSPAPRRRRGAAALAAITARTRALGVGLATLDRWVRRAALYHLALLAAWPAAIPWGEIARLMGPAWPANFGPPPRAVTATR